MMIAGSDPCGMDDAELPRSILLHTSKSSRPESESWSRGRIEAPVRWICHHEGCGRSYSRRDHYRVHLSMHVATGGLGFACSMCGKTLSSPDHLRTHVRLVHETEGKHSCPQCGFKFKTKSQLREHTLDAHGFHEFMCPHDECRKVFSSAWYLNQHLSTQVHDVLEGPRAAERKKRRKEPHQENQASSWIDSTRSLSEDSAGKSARNGNISTTTSKANTVSSYKCPVEGCGKSYTLKKNLLAHMRALHSALVAGDVSEKRGSPGDSGEDGHADPARGRVTRALHPFPCPALGCSGAFGYKSVLKRHLRKVHGLDISAFTVPSTAKNTAANSDNTDASTNASMATDDDEDKFDDGSKLGTQSFSICDSIDAPLTCVEC